MKSVPVVIAEIVDDIRRIYQQLTEQSRIIENETGLTGPQLWVTKILKDNSPIKISELARRMYLHPATMVGLLDRLESKGLVRRTRSEADRRVVYIDLTEQGHEIVKSSPEVVQSLLVEGLEVLPEKRLKGISTALDDIVKILGIHDLSPKLISTSMVNIPRRRKKTRINTAFE